MTELNGRRRTKSGETLEQGDVESKSAIMSRRNVSRWDYVLDRAPSLPMSHVSCQILPFIIPLVPLSIQTGLDGDEHPPPERLILEVETTIRIKCYDFWNFL